MRPNEVLNLTRRERRLTQKELGIKLGYDEASAQPVVAAWERGTQPIPLDKLRALCRILKLRCDCLLIPEELERSLPHGINPPRSGRPVKAKRDAPVPLDRQPPRSVPGRNQPEGAGDLDAI